MKCYLNDHDIEIRCKNEINESLEYWCSLLHKEQYQSRAKAMKQGFKKENGLKLSISEMQEKLLKMGERAKIKQTPLL